MISDKEMCVFFIVQLSKGMNFPIKLLWHKTNSQRCMPDTKPVTPQANMNYEQRLNFLNIYRRYINS